MTVLKLPPQKELAPNLPADLSKVKNPQYGRYLDEFVPGQVFVHPRGFTFDQGQAERFARTYMQSNPMYLNAEYAEAHGFASIPVTPQMVFNVTLSLGVQNDSEKVMANLGYYNARFLHPVLLGDTLRAYTQVMERKERGADKPGIVTIRTVSLNQEDRVVLQYERKLMVPWRGDKPETMPLPDIEIPDFPWVENPEIDFPDFKQPFPTHLTGTHSYFENFQEGDILTHSVGRTITDEHLALTYAVGNTHPLHFDKVYSAGLSGKMSGEPIVYGGLVFAWLEGLASRDVTENAISVLGFTEGYHTQPAVAGDTVAAISRVLAKEDAPGEMSKYSGIVTFQLIGVKNISAAKAVEEFGEDLFIKENNKKKLGKEKIPAKIFEIERQFLIKKRPA